ncbi:MAG: short-chain dehydrogenase/reductase, partial [Pseudarthrobacter sp.]|nr:short-chain dehydrogenase/reductase [Pseudarthrobacter sp.]
MSEKQNQTEPPADPRGSYHSDGFPKQEQEQPGLTAPMDPKPDHGELSYEGHGLLAGKSALITGGDSGIGKAAAIAFAREGADVAISYLPEEEDDARDTAEWIRKAGRKALLFPGDGRDEEFASRIVDEALAEFGRLDVLVLNA